MIEKRGVLVEEAEAPKQTKSATAEPPKPSAGGDLASRLADAAAEKKPTERK